PAAARGDGAARADVDVALADDVGSEAELHLAFGRVDREIELRAVQRLEVGQPPVELPGELLARQVHRGELLAHSPELLRRAVAPLEQDGRLRVDRVALKLRKGERRRRDDEEEKVQPERWPGRASALLHAVQLGERRAKRGRTPIKLPSASQTSSRWPATAARSRTCRRSPRPSA